MGSAVQMQTAEHMGANNQQLYYQSQSPEYIVASNNSREVVMVPPPSNNINSNIWVLWICVIFILLKTLLCYARKLTYFKMVIK